MSEASDPERAVEAPSTAEAAAPPSPGRLLRQARERAGLGAEDLAGQLKLAKSTLEALERDDFAALSEPVYVRGYYRKIAKVLPIAEAELIGAYDALNKPAATTPAMRRIPLAGGVAAGTSRQYRGQGLWIGVAVVIVAAVLFVLAEREPPQRLAEAPVPAATPRPAPSAAPAPAPETPAATPTPSTDAAAPDTSPAAPAASPAVTPPPAAVPNQLVLEFSESSFVRVEDSRGKTLAIGLVRGGERQALDGQPPYTVFLGNAQNVRVSYNGQPVDFSSHVNSQNDTARFTVP